MSGLTTIASGLRFPEGPVAMPDGSVILVEIAAGRVTRIRADGSTETVAETGGGPNGAAFEGLGLDQRTLNVLLFVPAGLFLVLAVGRWWVGVVLAPIGLVLLVAYSVGLEVVQLQLARIDRACDVTDMVDNSVGAGVGFLAGLVLLPVVRPWRGRVTRVRA